MSINRVIISGNVTRDSDLRATTGGMPVLSFGVAVNDRAKNQQTGEWEDRPNFIDCTMFGNRAEKLGSYIVKGNKVAIEGKLRWSQWEKDGQKRSKLEVIVDEMEFMSRSQQQGGYQQQPVQQPIQQPMQQPVVTHQMPPQMNAMINQAFQQPAPDLYDEDIPF